MSKIPYIKFLHVFRFLNSTQVLSLLTQTRGCTKVTIPVGHSQAISKHQDNYPLKTKKFAPKPTSSETDGVQK